MTRNCITPAVSLSLSLFLLLVAIGCSRDKAATADPDGTKTQTIAVTVAPVEARDVERRVEAVGTLHPDEEVIVYAQVSGRVEKILSDLEDHVKKEQVLLQLDQLDFSLQVQKAEAIVRQAKANADDAARWYERMESLHEEGAVSRNEVDNARAKRDASKATLDAEQAALDLARRNLGYTVIRAPMDGSVKERDVAVGQYIAGGSMQNTKLFILVREDPLKLKASVPERFQGQIQSGQEVKVRVEAYSGRDFTGTVTRVGPAVYTDTRTFPIEARVPNRDGVLKPGSFAKARVETRLDRDVAFIPEEALYYFVGITKAFVVSDGKVQERLVKVGDREDGRVEIVEGLRPGEQVATSRLSQLFDGAAVQVVAASDEKR